MAMAIKTIGSSGQISLGKQHAGRVVTVEPLEDGVWIIKVARVIPDSELWLHTEPAASRISSAIDWAETNPAAESDLDALEQQLDLPR